MATTHPLVYFQTPAHCCVTLLLHILQLASSPRQSTMIWPQWQDARVGGCEVTATCIHAMVLVLVPEIDQRGHQVDTSLSTG
jgi:hypothetical protein